MSDPRHIVLVGYRAAGKTTVGRLLAARLSRAFLDTDGLVEERAGCAIAEFFETGEEEAFREWEAVVLESLAELPPAVIATGGGCVTTPRGRAALGRLGVVVYLRAPASVLAARLARDAGGRPSLTGAPVETEVRGLLRRREPLYREVANVEVDANTSPQEVAVSVAAMVPGPG